MPRFAFSKAKANVPMELHVRQRSYHLLTVFDVVLKFLIVHLRNKLFSHTVRAPDRTNDTSCVLNSVGIYQWFFQHSCVRRDKTVTTEMTWVNFTCVVETVRKSTFVTGSDWWLVAVLKRARS